MTHICQPDRTCACPITALEPNEACPQHGYPWRLQCRTCGKFTARREGRDA